MPSELERAAARFRRELLANERAAASEMVRVYGASWQRVQAQLADVQARIREARAAGEDVSPAWLYQERRAVRLRAQIQQELRPFALVAEESATGLQAGAVTAAGRNSRELVGAAMGPGPADVTAVFDVLPREALQDLVGFAGDGSPLRTLFAEIADGTPDRVIDRLAASLAAGLGPRETARLLRREFARGLARALTISRTETLRAYREATHRNYEANDDVVEGWVWLATLSARTCAACWAMHGSVHSLNERLEEHPNGRCVAIPLVKSWAALGFPDVPDRRPVVEDGATAFAQLSEAEQRKVLGAAAFEAYRAGAVRLGDFAGWRESREWGRTLARRSLRQMVGAEAAGRWTDKARLIVRGEWRPEREDARLLAELQGEVLAVVGRRSGVRQVYVTSQTVDHYRRQHQDQFDMEVAERRLAEILVTPKYVYEGNKTNTVIFAGEYDDDHYLIVPVKVMVGEMWLETLYVRNNKRLAKDIHKARVLFRR